MEIQGRRLFIGLTAAFLIPLGMGFARSGGGHKASDRTTRVTLGNRMELGNGKTLPAGTYQVEVPANTQTPVVEFSQDGKVKATANAEVVSQGNKNPYTEVDSVQSGGTQVITTIRPSGWREILRFRQANQGGSTSGGQ